MKMLLPVLISICLSGALFSSSRPITRQSKIISSQGDPRTESLQLLDQTRNRIIPVKLYVPASYTKKKRLKPAILNHGYGGKNTDYSFIAENLAAHGYLVASIQHELPGDEPIPATGNLYEARKPNWQRGVQNILFTLQHLRKIRPDLDFENLLLAGHSNGGDMAMLFAAEHPQLVAGVISLDHRRMPVPRTRKLRILSIRSGDQEADPGVLPDPAEQKSFGMKIIRLKDVLHNDMWDGATEKQKREINQVINAFLENQTF